MIPAAIADRFGLARDAALAGKGTDAAGIDRPHPWFMQVYC
jgi:hypothetical protein